MAAVDTEQESDQKIMGFSLSNFGEKNEKTWDLKGETLEVFGNLIQLTNITANLYGKDEDMILTADEGSFDRAEGKVHLQDNVHITSETGAKMVTDTLDWFQNNQLVTTNDKVNISRGSLEMEGVGAVGKTDLKQFSLNKEVEVNITSESPEDETKLKKTTITCDGNLDIDYQGQTAVFNNNVKADDGESQLYADKMTAYFDRESKKIVKIISEGNVKIVRGQDISYSEKAIYDASSQKISLIGSPKIVFYSEKSLSDTKQ
jgi:LPS export ABC transporter protein LptC